MMYRVLFIFPLLSLAVAGCAREMQPAPVAREAVQASARQMAIEGRPVIAHLVGREYTVTITANNGVSLYSATDRNGVMLAKNVTAAELRALVPAAHQLVAPTVTASNDTERSPISGADRTPLITADISDFATD